MLGLTLALALDSAGVAFADITPTRDASALAAAIEDPLATGTFTGASFAAIPPAPGATVECADGADNDGDGQIDFTPPGGGTADTGCQSAADNLEQNDALAQCANGDDDDGDDTIDFTPPAGATADPGCDSADDNQETDGAPNPAPQCANGDDDDLDGKTDFTPPQGGTADPGCSSAADLDEGSEGLPEGQDSDPVATATSVLAGFPRSGSSYAILSNGNSRFADDPNDGGVSQTNGDDPSATGHGGTVHDLVQLRLDLDVPMSANCLQLDFRFLSEEYPEYVGQSFNDAFVAQLDRSDFSIDEAALENPVSAPGNFAFDSAGHLVSVNTVNFSADEASGTTYDGATPLLRASTPITPGAHSIYIAVFDQGDSIVDSAAFVDNLRVISAPAGTCKTGATSDQTAPATTITGGPTNGSATRDNTPSFSFSSNETGTFQCRVDGGDWADCTSPFTTGTLTDGQHTFEVRAIDTAGNIDANPPSRTFTVDTSPPDTSIDAGPEEGSSTADATPTFQFSSESGATFKCKVDGGQFQPCVSPFTTGTLGAGQHTFAVEAIDAAGNTDPSPASRTFTVTDTDPPDTTITNGPSGVTADGTPTFSFVSDEQSSTFECRVDSAAFAACDTPFTTGALGDGQHTFEVRARDASGNVDDSPASRTFTVDSTPPDTTITGGPAGPTADRTPTFTLSSGDNTATFECRVDSAAFAACDTPFTTGALGDGQHTFEVRARDASGNVDASPASRTFSVDTHGPQTTITSGPSGSTGDHTPTFAFAASEAGASFQCAVDHGPFASCASPKTTGPLADGEHTFRVRAIDALGNADATAATREFEVEPLLCFGEKVTIVGTGRSDDLRGTPRDDVIYTGGGDDTVDGRGGDDRICTSKGDDTVTGGAGDDIVHGGPGADEVDGGEGKDAILGDAGKDQLTGGAGADEITGWGGDDKITAGAGNDSIGGDEGDDVLAGGTGDDLVKGHEGDDELSGGDGKDALNGGDGKDVLRGDDDDDRLRGLDGDDTLFGNGGDDLLDGGAGRDKGVGGAGRNTIVDCEL